MEKYSLFCIRECPIGKKQSDEFLSQNNSAYDAALDMQDFVDKCKRTCKFEKERRNSTKEIKSMSYEQINHPSHYTDGKIEVIDFIEDKKLNYHRGNAVKYIARAGKKDGADTATDLGKAVWYLNREIQRITGEDPNAGLRKEVALDFAMAIESAFAYDDEKDVVPLQTVFDICADILTDKFGVDLKTSVNCGSLTQLKSEDKQ